jgi:multicomponent Na+:H+ antiporter subunit E
VTHLALLLAYLGLWILAWGQLTAANLLSGLVVATALLLAFPQRRRDGGDLRLSALGIVRLAAYIGTQLVTSNITMIGHILRRAAGQPGVVGHRLRQPSARVATVMSSVIALTPGTMTVDVVTDSSVLYVHFFDLHDVGRARVSLARLEQLVTGAIAARSDAGRTTVNQEPS